MIVDLPAPDAPTSATVLPAGMSSETSVKAATPAAVRKAHRIEPDRAARDCQRPRVRALADLGFDVEHGE